MTEKGGAGGSKDKKDKSVLSRSFPRNLKRWEVIEAVERAIKAGYKDKQDELKNKNKQTNKPNKDK